MNKDPKKIKNEAKREQKQENKIKILFLLKKRNASYGPSFGLGNSAWMVSEILKDLGIDSKICEIIDGNFADKEIHHYKPTHVIYEAIYMPPYKVEELAKLYPKVKFNVRIHSNLPFIQQEGMALKWLGEYDSISRMYPNVSISANNKKFLRELFYSMNIIANYTPNLYLFEEMNSIVKSKNKNEINIIYGGAIRPLKNILENAAAACGFADKNALKLKFHINGNRNEQHGENVLKNLISMFEYNNHELVIHEWMNHSDFLKLVQKMDMGMSVSFTETFSLTTANYVAMGIPVVTSKEISFVLPIYQANPTDIEDIISKLETAWQLQPLGIHNFNKLLLKQSNSRGIIAWQDFLCK